MIVTIQSRWSVFPETHDRNPSEIVKPLSILDATVLNFATSGCIWFYTRTLNVHRLVSSLKRALNAYPQFAGQLRYSEYAPEAGHTYRQGRLELAYGSSNDPGVECMFAHVEAPISAVIPPSTSKRIWDASKVDYQSFLNMDTPFGLNASNDIKGVTSMKVQFTTFASTGLAVAVGLVHPLADAQTVLRFTNDWAAINRALMASSPLNAASPLFDPSLIDAAAAENVDAESPNPPVLEQAKKLPLHRYDYWASATSVCPTWALSVCQTPAEINVTESQLRSGPQIPWETWDASAPVSHINFFFTAAEAHSIYLHAAAHTQARISHQDALLAHIWAAIIRARGLEEGKAHYMDISIDVRRRLYPPLPASFLGSPIINAACATAASTSTASEDLASDIADKAACIRNTIQMFDPESMAALLHEMAFELGAQRRWNCFLGDEHVIATSWVGIGLREVIFEPDSKPKWVEALLPSCDGLLQIMEGTGELDEKGQGLTVATSTPGGWWEKGVTTSLFLRSDFMANLVTDEALRRSAARASLN